MAARSYEKKFSLSEDFLKKYENITAPFGFDGLGEFVCYRTYARKLHDVEGAPMETWHQIVERVVNGSMNMLRRHLRERWQEDDYILTAQVMYDRIFHMKFLPSGRGLWAMGSPLTEERGLFSALSNCGFVSTLYIGCSTDKEKAVDPFLFLMDASMCGIGIGFDTLGEGHRLIVAEPKEQEDVVYVVEDSREGWVHSLRLLLWHYFFDDPRPIFDYSLVRAEGVPIKTFGGISGGPEPLRVMHATLIELFDRRRGATLTVTDIVDIMNIIGKGVVSGNVRRSAEIALGPNTEEFIMLKDRERNPQRQKFAYISNNSVKATVGDSYDAIAESICTNGEPGIFWTENVQAYSRMRSSERDWKDQKAIGTNPCAEQPLEHHELCCLVETFPAKHDDLQDFIDTLTLALVYVKIVTLGKTQWPETNKIIAKNRRVGVSMSGIAQFIDRFDIATLENWCNKGYAFLKDYDAMLSTSWGIAQSIKITTVKPSGTVSLLAGATPGIHHPISAYYIRRVRLAMTSSFIEPLRRAGYNVVPTDASEGTMVVEFPVYSGSDRIPCESSLTMIEQLEKAAFMQRNWSDNGVSVTIKFDKETEGPHIVCALRRFEKQLKAVSFLPKEVGIYKFAPYEPIDKELYEQLSSRLSPIDWQHVVNTDPKTPEYCDTDGCATPVRRERTTPRRLRQSTQ